MQVSNADEKCEERLAVLAEEKAKKAEQREERMARAEERRREIEEATQVTKYLLVAKLINDSNCTFFGQSFC